MLVGTCTALLGDAHLAQDVVQETFIRAFMGRAKFRGEREQSTRAWLTRIAINLCRDQQRARWFRFEDRRTPVDALPLAAPDAHAGARMLCAAVFSLPRKFREVILLHYYQDMPVADIAAALHLSPSSVYRRMDRAQQLLRRELERRGFDG